MGCVLPTCAQGLVEPSSRWLEEGENKWSSSWGLVLLLFILVSVLVVSTWMHNRGASSQWSTSILLGGTLPLSGPCPLGWGTALATVTTSPIFQGCVFLFPFLKILGINLTLFFKGMILGFSLPLGVLVVEREPTPCYRDAYSVGTPHWAFCGKGWQKHCKTMISPFLGRFFLVSKRTIFFFSEGGFFYGFYILVGPGILGLALVFFFLVDWPLSLLIWVAG